MAIDLFQAGSGILPLAYGKHLIGGILAEKSVDVIGSQTRTNLSVLLGYGEWDGIEELSYDGVIIDGSNYTFHPGKRSTGAGDSLQGQDPRFPSSIYRSNVPYYTVSLPLGMATEDRPDKLRAIVRCLKVNIYNPDGSVAAFSYSTNPADIFVDLIKRNCDRLKLNYQEYIDWDAYVIARAWYDQTIGIDDGKRTPVGIVLNPLSGGSLAAGTYYIRIVAVGSSGQLSSGSRTRTVSVGASGRIQINWEPEDDALGGYRVYFSSDSSVFNSFFTLSYGVTSFLLSTTSGATSGAIPTLPTGSWLTSQNRFKCNRAFIDSSLLLADALTAVAFDGGSSWVQDGKRYRLILPTPRESVHTFTVSNTLPNKFDVYRVERRDRFNRIEGSYRDITSPTLEQIDGHSVDRTDSQSKVGIKTESLSLGSTSPNQAGRLLNLRIRTQHDNNYRADLGSDGSAEDVILGDVVTLVDDGANMSSGKKFEVFESVDDDSNSADTREFRLWEYNEESYSDYDRSPLVNSQPTEIPSRFEPPEPITSMSLSEEVKINGDGTINSAIVGQLQFHPSINRQIGTLYHKRPGSSSYQIVDSFEPNPSTQLAGFRVETVELGQHKFKVLVHNSIGNEQSDPMVEYAITADGKDDDPSPPSSFTLAFDGTRVKGTIGAPSDRDIKGYNIYDGTNVFLFFNPSTEFYYGLKDTPFVLKAKAVDTSENESSSITAFYNPSSVDAAVLDKNDFTLGNVHTVDTNDQYVELNVVPDEADYKTIYLSIDAIRGIRVKVFNLFGQQIAETTTGFAGRGKSVLGFYERGFADAVEQAVFSIEFLNSSNIWSTPIYWTNESCGTNFWTTTSNKAWNGTSTIPIFPSQLDFAKHLTASPLSPTQVYLTWQAPQNSASTLYIYKRIAQRGLGRNGWTYTGVSVASGTTQAQVNDLSPNTEYEFMVDNIVATSRWSNVAKAKTQFAVPPPPSSGGTTLQTPSSLSTTPINQTTNQIDWTTSETIEDGTDVWRDGSYLTGISGTGTTYQDTTVTAGSTHYYKVKHFKSDGSGGYIYSTFSEEKASTTPSTPPPTGNDPTNFSASTYQDEDLGIIYVDLVWQRHGGGNAKIEYSLNLGSTWNTLTENIGGAEDYEFQAQASRHYEFRIFNVGGSGYSSGSNYDYCSINTPFIKYGGGGFTP